MQKVDETFVKLMVLNVRVCTTPLMLHGSALSSAVGGSVRRGEPERDAVHVVPDGVRPGLQGHEQVRRRPEEVPRDREGKGTPRSPSLGP